MLAIAQQFNVCRPLDFNFMSVTCHNTYKELYSHYLPGQKVWLVLLLLYAISTNTPEAIELHHKRLGWLPVVYRCSRCDYIIEVRYSWCRKPKEVVASCPNCPNCGKPLSKFPCFVTIKGVKKEERLILS